MKARHRRVDGAITVAQILAENSAVTTAAPGRHRPVPATVLAPRILMPHVPAAVTA